MTAQEKLNHVLALKKRDPNYTPSTTELLQNLARIRQALQGISSGPVQDVGPGRDPRLMEAEDLEEQAVMPYPTPQGLKEHFVSGIQAGLEGFTGGLTGGPGYFEREQQRQGQHRLEQQDRLARVKQLREEARQAERDTLDARRISGEEEEREANRDFRNQQLELQREQIEQGRFQSGAQGIYDVRTGKVKTPAEPKESPLPKRLASYTNANGEHVEIFQNPDGTTTQTVMGKVREPQRDTTLSPYSESNIVNRLTSRWDRQSTVAVELGRQVQIMEAGMEAARRGDLAQGSQAVLITFQKILDPTSVVRESEYARSAAGLSLLSRIEGAADRLQQGGAGVPLSELEKYATLARELAQRQGRHLASIESQIEQTADRYRIPRELVTTDFTLEPAETETPSNETRSVNGVIYEKVQGGWRRRK